MTEAFVYIWINKTNGRKYIGYHKGRKDDSYISSSHNDYFWEDFNNPEMVWERNIIFEGSVGECLYKEQQLLKEIDLKSYTYYNNARGRNIVFSDEVRAKMSKVHKERWLHITTKDDMVRRKKIADKLRGRPRSVELKKKLSDLYIGRSFEDKFGKDVANEIKNRIKIANTGKKRTEAFKNEQKIRSAGINNPMFGRKHTQEFKEIRSKRWMGANNPNYGKPLSDEVKRKISEKTKGRLSRTKGIPRNKITCPHCGKEGGDGMMQRWHFDNCKNK